MHTLKQIREERQRTVERLAVKGVDAAPVIEKIIAEDDLRRSLQQRLDGCLDALQRLGVPFDFDRQYRLADFSMQGGYAAAEHLLAHCPGLTAIFAMSDLMALGAIRALQDHGLRVPQDISVAGYDGIALGQYSIPRLTTIRQDMEQLAQRSAKILLHCIEEPGRAVHEVVPFDLIEGESVGKV